MIHIGKTYIKREKSKSFLCSDVIINNNKITLWYSIDTEYENYLCINRADAFVMALLVQAMTFNHDIKCDDPISAKFKFFLTKQYIPTLSENIKPYHNIKIDSDITTEPYKNCGAVGVGFSAGSDSMYSVINNTKMTCKYPLTHIAVFNCVNFEKYEEESRNIFINNCKALQKFANQQKLKLVALDTNFYEELHWKFTNEIVSMRIISCALALQGLFSVYLVSSPSFTLEKFNLELEDSTRFDLLTINSASTESLSIYLSGAEADKVQKITQISDYEPSYKYLHSCFSSDEPGKKNCGTCKKCKDAQIILYALEKLDNYNAVYDTENFKKDLPKVIAYYLNRKDPIAKKIIKLLKENNIEIPEKSIAIAKQIEKVRDIMSKKIN